MRHLSVFSVFSVFAISLVSGLWTDRRPTVTGPFASLAHADDAPACMVRGRPLVGKGIQVFDEAREGRVIAEFIGGAVPLAVTLASEPLTQRSRVATSAGKPSLRLDGWMDASSLTVYATRDVPVVGEHVKIAGGTRVKPVRATGSSLTSEISVSGTPGQTVKGTGPCDAYSFDWARPTVADPPETAQRYLIKGSSLELFDRPGGASVFTLTTNDGASPLFWSLENRGMFLHVTSRSDLAIDAWVKLGTVTLIRKDDRVETPPSAPPAPAGAKLVLDNPPPPQTATKDVPVRAQRDDKSRTIGTLERGAEFFVVQLVDGWANLLPRALNVSPPDGGGFWVRAADVGK